MPIKLKNPLIKNKTGEISELDIEKYIKPEVEKRMEGLDIFIQVVKDEVELRLEEEKKKLTPEIKFEEKIIEKEVFKDKIIMKKNPINKVLFGAVIVLGLVVAFLLGKNLLAAGLEEASKIFYVTNYYDSQSLENKNSLGSGIVNPSSSYLRNLRDVSVSGVSSGNLLGYSSSGYWEATSTRAGVGDVVGPSGAIDSNFVAFDSTTGKLIKDSGYSFSSFLSDTGNFHGTWDGYATNTLPYLSSSLNSGLIFIGNSANVAEASSTSNLTGLPYLSNTNSYLLKSASTTIPNLPTALQIFKWSQWQQASTTKIGLTDLSCTAAGLTYTNTTGVFSWTSGYEGFTTAFKNKMNSFQQASTSLPYVSSSLPANSYIIGNASNVAEATTTINLLTKAFTVASSTYLFSAGSSTIPLGYQFYQDTWTSIACKFIGGSSPTGHIVCGDGTNNINTLNITDTMASTTLSTNNVLQVKDLAQCTLEAVTNAPDLLTCNIAYKRN